MEVLGVRSTDTKFLNEATEQLISSRRVLQYSYVMGFYLDRTKQAEKNLFEYLQEDLEKHTNDLSTCYERGCARMHTISYHEFMKWKEEMNNKIRVSAKFLDNFLKGVAEGLLVYQ
jgi:ariadne-1